MTNKLVVIINSLVLKIKKIFLYEMKLLILNYSCLQNPWLGGYRSHIPVLSVVCPQLNLLNPPPEKNSWVRHWYVSHYIDTRSRHHCWRGKAISVTYSWRVSAALLIQYAMRMRCIVIRWPVWQYHIFPHYLTIDTILGWKKFVELKICVFISYTTFFWNIPHYKKN